MVGSEVVFVFGEVGCGDCGEWLVGGEWIGVVIVDFVFGGWSGDVVFLGGNGVGGVVGVFGVEWGEFVIELGEVGVGDGGFGV